MTKFYLVRKDSNSPVEVSEEQRDLVYCCAPEFGVQAIGMDTRMDAASCAMIMNRPVNKPRVDWHGVWRKAKSIPQGASQAL